MARNLRVFNCSNLDEMIKCIKVLPGMEGYNQNGMGMGNRLHRKFIIGSDRILIKNVLNRSYVSLN